MLLDIDFDVSTRNLTPVAVSHDLQHRVEQFLYGEARLLDEQRFDAWQSLWTDTGMYWMPQMHEQESPYDHISLFWEDRMMRSVRIRRLEHARNWSQQPPSHTARLVGNVIVDGEDAEGNLVVRSVFQMTEWRKVAPRQLAGAYTHKLTPMDEGWRMHMKRIDLVTADSVQDIFEVFV